MGNRSIMALSIYHFPFIIFYPLLLTPLPLYNLPDALPMSL